jgi:hypothetical protein
MRTRAKEQDTFVGAQHQWSSLGALVAGHPVAHVYLAFLFGLSYTSGIYR